MPSKVSRRAQRPVTRIEPGPDQSRIVRHPSGAFDVHLDGRRIGAAVQQALRDAQSPWVLVEHTIDEDGVEWVRFRRDPAPDRR